MNNVLIIDFLSIMVIDFAISTLLIFFSFLTPLKKRDEYPVILLPKISLWSN